MRTRHEGRHDLHFDARDKSETKERAVTQTRTHAAKHYKSKKHVMSAVISQLQVISSSIREKSSGKKFKLA